MKERPRAGELRVRYRRQYGAAEYTIVSPVLDSHTIAVPVRSQQGLALPGNEDGVTGIAVQSYLMVLAPDDPATLPMVVRPWWIATEQAEVDNCHCGIADVGRGVDITLTREVI